MSLVADLVSFFNQNLMRSYHNLLIVVGILLLQSLSSCKHPTETVSVVKEVTVKSPVTVQSDDYYPLAVGDEWWFKPDSTINFFDRYDGNVVRVVSERKVGNTFEYELTDSTLDRTGNMERFTLVKEGSKVWRKSTTTPNEIDWLIDFSATTATPDKDNNGYVMERIDTYKVYAGIFKDNVRVFFPSSAYDGMPVILVAKGIGPISYSSMIGRTYLNKAIVGGVKYGNW
jgi:hypothetical protein